MIVGVDISSHRVDLAWLEDGKPQRWHQILTGGKHDNELIDRLRRIRVQWPGRGPNYFPHPDWDVTDIAIEMPFATKRNAIAALMATLGVITRQAPPWARVAWPSSGELRAAIGAANKKTSAHARLGYIVEYCCGQDLSSWDEHELDALVACIGWTRILEAQDAA